MSSQSVNISKSIFSVVKLIVKVLLLKNMYSELDSLLDSNFLNSFPQNEFEP